MTTEQILQATKLNPDKLVLSVTTSEAIDRLIEFIKEWELSIKIGEINSKDWETLLNSYGDAVINYHPDNDHQERIVFLKNEKMLIKYGLTSEDITRLDF